MSEETANRKRIKLLTDTVLLLNSTVSVKPIGAKSQELDSLQKIVGFEFPEPFLDLYSVVNGEINCFSEDVGVLCGYYFLSAAEILDEYFQQEGLSPTDPELLVLQGTPRNLPKGTIEPFLPKQGWVPFAKIVNSYLAIDLTPGVNGVYGQIINYGRDDDCNFQISKSIDSFLEFNLECARKKVNFQEYFPENLGLYDYLYSLHIDPIHGSAEDQTGFTTR